MGSIRTLKDMKPGEKAIIRCSNAKGSIRRRFLDIGLIENTRVECIGRSPLGDPAAFLIRGAVIAIRKKDCEKIDVWMAESGEKNYFLKNDTNTSLF